MENYFCANSVEEQVDLLTDKVKDIITNKLDKASIVQETGTGTDVVMSQKAVTDAIANKGLDTLTDVNLTLGNTTVQYDPSCGIELNSTARFTDVAGNHDATMNLALPIVGINGITIGKAADSEKIEINGNNFVKKSTSTNGVFIYARQNGAEITQRMDYSNTAEGQSVPRRDVGGSLYVPDSSIGRTDYNFQAGQEAVNKKYVDNAIANIGSGRKLYRHDITKTIDGVEITLRFFDSKSIALTDNEIMIKHHGNNTAFVNNINNTTYVSGGGILNAVIPTLEQINYINFIGVLFGVTDSGPNSYLYHYDSQNVDTFLTDATYTVTEL